MNYLDFANKDLNSAKILHKYTGEYDNIVVLCQQYLEKAFKYLLDRKLGELSKSHKLVTLSKKLEINELDKYENFLRKVQDYYFDKRYPSEDYMETIKEECDEVVKTTLIIKEIIEAELNKLNKVNTVNTELKQCNLFDNLK
ncbi:HEPN domain-containing protein [Clostridium uliginosum]|uniref:HEPN domain-containing protein n=1 Tax=Clostridium uliginosum TaxID=119641 RepID=A0A1I1MIP0_9CLOT|nr:HEPN domain-containing protein [Clostridium uliginosum]SFC84965.1 HEPN domain-containing protein [Clostridium uliginosum]